MSFGGLPGGRGPRRGEDASVNQRESDVQRAKQSPSHFEPIWGTGSHTPSLGTATTQALSANQLRLHVVLPPSEVFETRAIRVSASAVGAATAYVDTVVYVYDRDSNILTALKIARVGLPTNTTYYTATYPTAIQIVPGEHLYFVGSRRGADTVTLNAAIGLTANHNRSWLLTLPVAQEIPRRISLSQLLAGPSSVPLYTFLSQRWDSLL